MPRWLWSALTAALLMLPAGVQGCSKSEDAPEHKRVEGVIERIDLAKSEVTLRYHNPKYGQERTITGKATATTEIFINGALRTLEDLHEGERVSVVGWIRGHGADREVVAEEIRTQRAETIRRQPKPATAPAHDTAGWEAPAIGE